MRVAVEGIAPTAAAAVVEHDALARLHRHPVGGVRDFVRVVAAVAQDHLVGRAVVAAADARHRVLHADDVRVHLGVDADFLLVVRCRRCRAIGPAPRVGAIVAAPLHVRVERLVDLGRRLPQVAEARVERTPGVHALRGVAPARVDLGRVIGERRAGARIDADDDRGDAGLVRLRHGAVGQHVLHRLGDHLADVGAGMVRSGTHRLARFGVQQAALGHDQLDLFEEPFVLRDLGIHHRGDLPDGVAARVAERRPRLQLGTGVGAGEVDRELVARHRHLHVQVDVGIAERVVVDV